MIKKQVLILSGNPGYGNKNVMEQISSSIQEIVAQKQQEEESKKFNYFVETGEVLPEKDKAQYSIEALAELTSIVRPGPLKSFSAVPKTDQSKILKKILDF